MFELFVWDHHPSGYEFHLFQVFYELSSCWSEGINSNVRLAWQSASHLCLGVNVSGRVTDNHMLVLDYRSVSQLFFSFIIAPPSLFRLFSPGITPHHEFECHRYTVYIHIYRSMYQYTEILIYVYIYLYQRTTNHCNFFFLAYQNQYLPPWGQYCSHLECMF